MNRGELIGRPIIVGVDDSSSAQRALGAALDLAHRLGNELIVVSAYHPVHDSKLKATRRDAPPDVTWRLQSDSAVEALLEDVRERADAAAVPVECIARQGAPASVICEIAAQKRAGLIVVGNRGMRGRGRLKGSVANDVSHRAECSVLIVDTVGAIAA